MQRFIAGLGLNRQKPKQPPGISTAVFMQDDTREAAEQRNRTLALEAELLASTARLQAVEIENTSLRAENNRLHHELHTALQTIADLKRMLDKLEEDYAKFVGTVLDKINSPIHVINGSAAFLSRDLSDLRKALEHASLPSTDPNAIPDTRLFLDTITHMKDHLESLLASTDQQSSATDEMLLTFRRKIPTRSTDTRYTSTAHTSPTPEAHIMPPALPRKLKVLAVDDIESVLTMTRKQLLKTHALETAMSGEAAIKAWETAIKNNAPFDVIIMDVCMPGMGGLKATQTIRQCELEKGIDPIPIIGLSGNTQPEDKALGLKSGMSDYLTKPCTREILVAAIDKALAQSQSERTTSDSSPETMERSRLLQDDDEHQRRDRCDTHP